MRKQLFIIKAPDQWINANDRVHWSKKATRTRAWREAAHWHAKAAREGQFPRAHVEVTLYFADKNRRRDAGNYAPTIKAVIDGLVAGGVLADDSDEFMVGPDIRCGTTASLRTDGFVGIEVWFTELPAVAGGIHSARVEGTTGRPGSPVTRGMERLIASAESPAAPTGGEA